jgi:prepilin-type N-terminal cleavage/methylation domain-containing protein
MQTNLSQTLPGWRKNAFTLVEMLVVIAIIAILMAAGSIGLSGMGGKGVTSGVATAESLFDEARTTAVGRNLRACVLIAKSLDNNSSEDLRRIVVAYQETRADGTPVETDPSSNPKWILSSRGTVLPDQTFFSEQFSRKNHTAGSGSIDEVSASQLLDISGGSLKSTSPYKGSFYKYEFNSQGICSTPGASFIIGTGTRTLSKKASEAPPRVMASARRDFGGFVIWRNGRTSVFRSPDQMGSGIKSIQSGKTF